MMDAFARQSLEAHNKCRAVHNVPSLSWSTDLARDAQIWAKKLAKEKRLMHDQLKGVGENVFMSSQGFDTVGETAVKSWYSEVERYDFKSGGHQPGTGHFTQVVWKGTKEVGVARAKSSDGAVYVVARYRPAGNNLNTFDKNVLPKVSTGDPSSAERTGRLDEQVQDKTTQKGKLVLERQKPLFEDAAFIDTVLRLHNGYRSLHNVGRLQWSFRLAQEGQDWAEKLAREGKLHHASKEERNFKGENICRMSNHYDIRDAVRIWYSEIKDYDFESPKFSLETGHFSQIVWRSTCELGVGTSQSADGKLTYLVARYNPPGNILSRFEENVLPKVH